MGMTTEPEYEACSTDSSYWADNASVGFPSEVQSFDLYITTFLWRQSTQHEGVMPIAP